MQTCDWAVIYWKTHTQKRILIKSEVLENSEKRAQRRNSGSKNQLKQTSKEKIQTSYNRSIKKMTKQIFQENLFPLIYT